MASFSSDELDFIAKIKNRNAERNRRRKEFRETFELLSKATLKPDVILMNQQDYEDIVKWSKGEP